jgi:hypothetical protein
MKENNMTNKTHDDAMVALEALIADTIMHWTKARDGVQQSLVGVLSYVHLTQSQDHASRLVNVLIDGIGNGINANAIREWCGLHLNMILNKENKLVCRKFDIDAFSTTKAASVAKKWFDLKVQKPVMFDLDAQIVALLKKAVTASAKPVEEMIAGSVVNVQDDALKALRVIAAEAATRIETAKASKLADA